MDSLVFKKFDLVKWTLIEAAEEDIKKFENELASKGGYQGSYRLNGVTKILKKSAEEIIGALLETYEDVGKLTGEELVVLREQEIMDEANRIANEEGERIHKKITKISQELKINISPEYSNVWANFVSRSRQRAECLIGIHKRRYENSKPKKSFTNEVFVIMQIGNPGMDRIWKEVFDPVIRDFKLEPRRIDKHNEGKFLMSEVADLLNRSKLVIADLTNERPNCYLEVGYTMGIDKFTHLILCANENHNPDSPNYKQGGPKIHFDIGGYDFVFWKHDEIDEFKTNLAKKIRYRLTVIDK